MSDTGAAPDATRGADRPGGDGGGQPADTGADADAVSGPRRSWTGGILTAVAAVALGAIGTPLALAGAALVGLAWAVTSPVGAVAVGQVALVALAETATLDSLVIAQSALALLLFEPAVRARRSVRHVVTTAGALGGLGAVAAGTWLATGQVAVAAGAVAALTVLCCYLLHRWSLLSLGVLHDA